MTYTIYINLLQYSLFLKEYTMSQIATLETIRNQLTSRIKTLGYNVSEYNDELFNSYLILNSLGIEISNNLLNPKIDQEYFNLICEFIKSDVNKDIYIKMLPYIIPGVSCIHFSIFHDGFTANNLTKVDSLIKILNSNISDDRKYHLVQLLKRDLPFEHLLNPAYSDHDVDTLARTASCQLNNIKEQ